MGENQGKLAPEAGAGRTQSDAARFFLAAIIESLEDSVVSVDFDTVITSWNKAAERLYGYPAEEVIGKPLTMLTLPEDLAQLLENIESIKRSGSVKVYETERVHKDGHHLHLSITLSPVKDDAGRVIGVSTVARDVSARRKFEAALRESNSRFNAALAVARLGTFEWDVRTDAVTLDARSREIFGFADGEGARAQEIFDRIHPADRDRVYAEARASVREMSRLETEYRVNLPDGTARTVVSTSNVIPAPDGRAGRLFGVFSDITEMKKTEERLRQSREMLGLAMSGSRMGAWSRNLTTEEVYWSPELEALFGLPEGAFAGTLNGFYDYVHDEDKERIALEVQRAVAERRGYSIEFRYRHADGGLRWMEGRGQATYAPDGAPLNMYGIGVDITERKRAELNAEFLAGVGQDLVGVSTPQEIVRTVGERLNRFLGTSTCAFVEVDETAESAAINYEWHAEGSPSLAGSYTLSEFVTPEFLRAAKAGQPIVVRDVETDPRIADPRQWAPLQIRAHVNVPLIRGGEWRFSLCVYHAAPYDWRDDEIDLMRELSSRVWARLERAFAEQEREGLLAREHAARLQAEEASRLKDEFLATVSHELRTPLTAILGWAEMLTSGKAGEEVAPGAIETIYRNARAQAQLVEDILDVSRIITGKLRINARPIMASPIIQTVVESLRPSVEAKNIRLRLRLDLETRTLYADPDRLQQVVWNLLSNAVKFTPDGGQVTVGLECDEAETRITVSDTGKGITPEFLPHVFDRFSQADGTTTRRHGGLGLGLALVRHIVEFHGGTVEVRSPGEGRGATFTVRLPVPDAPAPGDEAARLRNSGAAPPAAGGGGQAASQIKLRGLRVVVVDDERDTLELLAVALAQQGVEVRARTNAREALEVIREWKPDMVISDIAMPEEDGYSLIRKLRALPPDEGGATPAVALTAYVGVEERTRVLSSGFQAYVPKPVEPSGLLSILAGLV